MIARIGILVPWKKAGVAISGPFYCPCNQSGLGTNSRDSVSIYWNEILAGPFEG